MVFVAALSIGGATAQSSDLGFVSEDYEVSSTDENGVDIISGSVRLEQSLVSIGPEGGALSYSVITPSLANTGSANDSEFLAVGLPINTFRSSPFKYDSFSGGVSISGVNDCNNWFEIAGNRSDFCGTLINGLIAKDGSNATLTQSGSEYTYTDAQGTKFISDLGISTRTTETAQGLKRVIYPSGRTIEITRSSDLVSVIDSRGLQLRMETSDSWINTTVTAFNMAVDFCSPTASSCSFSEAWPQATIYTGSATTNAVVTDMAGLETWLYPRARSGGFSGYSFNKVKPAGAAASAMIEYTFCGPWHDTSCAPVTSIGAGTNHSREARTIFSMTAGKVSQVVRDGETWTYTFDYWEY
jgi:hypothetical protein